MPRSSAPNSITNSPVFVHIFPGTDTSDAKYFRKMQRNIKKIQGGFFLKACNLLTD
jgi:hypothetical protein